MARRHYWQFLVTDEGNPIENANIEVYLAGTDTAANVYFAETGGLPSNTIPQTVTSKKGYFEFWVSDNTDTNGYEYSQKFKVGWSATGVAVGHIDYIDVFSTSVSGVVLTSTDEVKNKVYALFIKSGITTLREIDLKSGELTRSIAIPNFAFVQNIKVRDDVVYFLYKERINEEYKQLYKLALSSSD